MTEPLQVGQFAIVDHEPVERGPNAGIFTGRGPAGDRPELYVFAEGTTPAGEAFAGHVISAAGQRWSSYDMSVTGALKRVFEDADENLRDWNRKSIAQHRVRLGLAGVARRGGQTVLAQAGPSAVFHRTRTGVLGYFASEEHAAPLGTGVAVSPQFRRIDFEPGDRLLLLSTAALTEMGDDVIAGIIDLPADQVLANVFRRVRGLRDVTALLLACPGPALAEIGPADPDHVIGAGAVHQAAEEAEDEVPGFQPSLFISERAEDDVDLARRQLVAVSERVRLASPVVPSLTRPIAVPEPLRRAVGGDIAQVMLRPRASTLAVPAFPRILPGGNSASTATITAVRDESFSRSITRRPPPPPPPVSNARPAADLADDRRAEQRVSVPVIETLAAADGVALEAAPLVRVRSGRRARFRPGASRGRELPSFGHPPTWLIAAGGVLALIVVVGIIAGPRLFIGDDNEKFLSLIDGAEQNLATARVVQDAAARRDAYSAAQAMLLEAREMATESTEVARLLLEVEEGLNELDAVRTPFAVTDVASLEQFGNSPVTPDVLAVGDGVVFLLDGANGQVVSVPLDGGLSAAVYAADEASGRARPIAVAYYASTDLGSPMLLIADAQKGLWGLVGGEVQAIRFAVPGDVTDIATAGGDLYVLDAPGRTIYRLLPSDGGFVNPTVALTGDSLVNAVRLTVIGDEVYTANQDGTVHFFAGSLSLEMAAAGIDKPLTTARKPWVTGVDGEIAVLDPENDRIVVLRQDGTFAHQFRHADFETAAAFAIQNGIGYIFSGAHLRVITFEE